MKTCSYAYGRLGPLLEISLLWDRSTWGKRLYVETDCGEFELGWGPLTLNISRSKRGQRGYDHASAGQSDIVSGGLSSNQ